jgi:hypothetical protein
MIIRDNQSKNFTLHMQTVKDKKYGFAMYGQPLKDAFANNGWRGKKAYPITIMKHNKENMILCFKEQILDKQQSAVRELKINNSISKSG